jgi:hypothetical protein
MAEILHFSGKRLIGNFKVCSLEPVSREFQPPFNPSVLLCSVFQDPVFQGPVAPELNVLIAFNKEINKEMQSCSTLEVLIIRNSFVTIF